MNVALRSLAQCPALSSHSTYFARQTGHAGVDVRISGRYPLDPLQGDSSFGTAGIVDTAVSTLGDAAFAVTVQSDGKNVAGGLARDSVDGYGVIRINP